MFIAKCIITGILIVFMWLSIPSSGVAYSEKSALAMIASMLKSIMWILLAHLVWVIG